MTARVLDFSKKLPVVKTRRENALSKLDYLELCFLIGYLVLVAVIVGAARSMKRRLIGTRYDKPRLVENESDLFADIIAVIT